MDPSKTRSFSFTSSKNCQLSTRLTQGENPLANVESCDGILFSITYVNISTRVRYHPPKFPPESDSSGTFPPESDTQKGQISKVNFLDSRLRGPAILYIIFIFSYLQANSLSSERNGELQISTRVRYSLSTQKAKYRKISNWHPTLGFHSASISFVFL